jgi:peptidoglycan-associated lipoprotein
MRTALHLTLAVALMATASACSRRAPQELPPAPTDQGGSGQGGSGIGGAAVPGSAYNIDATDRATLDSQAQWLRRYPNVRVLIEGHADERGTRDYNLALGQRRAEAARNYLVAAGIPANRIDVISYGKERPEATGSDEQSWAQNRRAVTVTIQ